MDSTSEKGAHRVDTGLQSSPERQFQKIKKKGKDKTSDNNEESGSAAQTPSKRGPSTPVWPEPDDFKKKLKELLELHNDGLIPEDVYHSAVSKLTETRFFSHSKVKERYAAPMTTEDDEKGNDNEEDGDNAHAIATGSGTEEVYPHADQHNVSKGLLTPLTPKPISAQVCDQTQSPEVDEFDDLDEFEEGEDNGKTPDFESFEEFLSVAAPMLWLLGLIFVGHIIIEWILGVDMPRCVDYLLHPIATVGTFRTGRLDSL